jgi:hypothetical protein
MLGEIGHADIFGFIKKYVRRCYSSSANRIMTSGTERFILLLSGAAYSAAPLTGARQEWPPGHGGVARLPENLRRFQAPSRFALARHSESRTILTEDIRTGNKSCRFME